MNVRASGFSPTFTAARTTSPSVGSTLRTLPFPLVQAGLIVAALWVLLDGWHRDLRVPLGFVSDSLFYLAQSKSTIDNGWWWWNPRLGAPIGLDEVAYPSNSTVDQSLVWLVSRVVPDTFAAINVTWILLVVLSGLTATWCMRTLGVSRASAFVAGTLFALSPYALYRNVDHFALVIYLVPFACAAALSLAAGEPHQIWGRTRRIGLGAGCVLLGFNYVYYAFFGAFCLLVGALIGYLPGRDTRVLRSGVLCLALIAGSTVINLAPTFYSWFQNGQPLILREKVPAEAETYGLKIRHLVSPVFPHVVPSFNRWV
jgi:phosphoglycerol transferase